MSRIHEALQKARHQNPNSAQDLPSTDEIIAAGTAWTAPASTVEPIDEIDSMASPRQPADTKSLIKNCRFVTWNPGGGELVFASDSAQNVGQELFRTLRSRLHQIRGTRQSGVILVTSAIPHEGKSFVTCNLANAFAIQSACRTLIIDADLRRSDGATALLGAPKQPGLSDYLSGEMSLPEVLQSGGIENLYLIPCGKRVSNAGELISHSRFQLMLQQLRPVFDWIVIDTPPALPLADARVVAGLADGVLFVIDSQATHANLIKRAVAGFERNSILGVVLNNTTDNSTRYYSDYHYDEVTQRR